MGGFDQRYTCNRCWQMYHAIANSCHQSMDNSYERDVWSHNANPFSYSSKECPSHANWPAAKSVNQARDHRAAKLVDTIHKAGHKWHWGTAKWRAHVFSKRPKLYLYLRTLYFPLLLLNAWRENQARARAQADKQGRKISSLFCHWTLLFACFAIG